MKLHFRTLGSGFPLLIMHGVFGSSDNWQTLGKIFAHKFKVYLIDLRNHGNSPHNNEFSYEAMAKDVLELMADEHISYAHILGHSMGGKVAMQLATQHPKKIDKLIVVDIAPKYYPPHHQQIFDGFHSVNLEKLANRKDADKQMAAVITNVGIRQFILKNLIRKKDGFFGWKLHVHAIEKAVKKLSEGLERDTTFDGHTLFIAGGNSDYISENDHPLIKNHFPKAIISSVEGASHWVHADKPDELSKMVIQFLSL